MGTAIVINLDYANIPVNKCKHLWELIEVRMEKAGFVKCNRTFISNEESEAAYGQARDAIDGILEEFLNKGECVAHYLREFYGIPCEYIADLSTPSVNEIKVDVMESGSFQEFFPETRCCALFGIGKYEAQSIDGLSQRETARNEAEAGG
jgi:hypothetical protein